MARSVQIGGSAGFGRENAESVWVVPMNDVSREMRTLHVGNQVVHPPPMGVPSCITRCRAGSSHPGMAANFQEYT